MHLQDMKNSILVNLTKQKPMKDRLSKLMLTILTICLTGSTLAADKTVDSEKSITAAIAQAQPGDTITLINGTYRNIDILFNVNGKEGAPITLTVESRGKVFLEGESSLAIAGDYLVVDGLHFRNGRSAEREPVIRFYDSRKDTSTHADHSQLTNTTIDSFNAKKGDKYNWVDVMGSHNLIDHNHFKDMVQDGVTVIVTRRTTTDDNYTDLSDNHIISHNYFNTRISSKGKGKRGNGQEGIKIGSGGSVRAIGNNKSTFSKTRVEYNLFESLDAEAEMVSIKSDGNTIRYNTFNNNGGAVTLRNGEYSEIYGNFFDGMNKSKSTGVRIIGKGHKVYNNHIQNMDRGGLIIHGGCSDKKDEKCWSKKKEIQYRLAEDLEIYNNTIVNSSPSLLIGFQNEDTMRHGPINSTIANNAIYFNVDNQSASLLKNGKGMLDIDPSISFMSNIFYGSSAGIEKELKNLGKNAVTNSEIIESAPGLIMNDNGVWVPSSVKSIVVDAVSTNYTLVNTDVLGLPRGSKHDVGAAEYTTAGRVNKPLTAADVGPYATSIIIPSPD